MKYALVLESCSENCSSTSSILASMGYLITPVFSPRKALHAAHMIQFDLIITCMATIPDSRRSLTGDLARCAPEAVVILLTDAGWIPDKLDVDGAHAIMCRPLNAEHIDRVVKRGAHRALCPISALMIEERQKRIVD